MGVSLLLRGPSLRPAGQRLLTVVCKTLDRMRGTGGPWRTCTLSRAAHTDYRGVLVLQEAPPQTDPREGQGAGRGRGLGHEEFWKAVYRPSQTPHLPLSPGPGAAGGGRLCFRQPERRFRCRERECRAYRSQGPGGLVANVLSNGSVLVQWGGPGSEGRRRGGFLLSCSWNGSYTQFQCDRVRLGASCRDYLLTEAHEGVRYHVCLQALGPPAGPPDCLDFTLLPSGMQDIVIAMTAVGGAICVMLVIICLLVAYITENLMNPASTHPRAQAH
nr:PREDICTED: fibronectin type-III domain-containing transmembrane protein C1orf233 homolog [Lepisosteus oculatus]